mgnify:CR=1 FL=1
MTIKELDDKLNSPGFQDTENGDLFYNFFIYQYPAEKEYDIRKQIQEFKQNLIRPTNYVDVLTLDLFEEFCNYLNGQKFLKFDSMLQYLLEKEQEQPDTSDKIFSTLERHAHSEKFVKYLHERIVAHITIDDEYRRSLINSINKVLNKDVDEHKAELRALCMASAPCILIFVPMNFWQSTRITMRPDAIKSFSFIPDIGNKVHSNSLIP